jgi:hypothetical protein
MVLNQSGDTRHAKELLAEQESSPASRALHRARQEEQQQGGKEHNTIGGRQVASQRGGGAYRTKPSPTVGSIQTTELPSHWILCHHDIGSFSSFPTSRPQHQHQYQQTPSWSSPIGSNQPARSYGPAYSPPSASSL